MSEQQRSENDVDETSERDKRLRIPDTPERIARAVAVTRPPKQR